MAAPEQGWYNSPSVESRGLGDARHKIAEFLLGVSDPAVQATAFQLSRTVFKVDRSFCYCIVAICFAVLEELL